MHSIKAKIHIATWNGSVGAKGEHQLGWFRVRGVPYDKRSVATMTYVRSLVGATANIDKTTLGRTDYVRIRIAGRDISKVTERAEGTIIPYLYDFLYEREVEMGNNVDGGIIIVQGDNGSDVQLSPKKPRQEGPSHQPKLQLQIFSKSQDGNAKDSHDGKGSRSAPPKSSLDNLNELAT
jgi:hypothetical protein